MNDELGIGIRTQFIQIEALTLTFGGDSLRMEAV